MQSLKALVGRTVLANPISQEEYEPLQVLEVTDQEFTLQWPATEEVVVWNVRYVWRVWPGPVTYTGRESGGRKDSQMEAAAQIDLIHVPTDQLPVRGTGVGVGIGIITPID